MNCGALWGVRDGCINLRVYNQKLQVGMMVMRWDEVTGECVRIERDPEGLALGTPMIRL